VEQKPGRIFGGTNTKTNPNALMAGKGMAIQEEAATPSFWGGSQADKGVGFGWSVGGKKVNSAPAKAKAPARPAPKKGTGTFTAFAKKETPKKTRIFGGTNTKTNPNALMAGKGMAIQDEAATPSYWGGSQQDKGVGFGWFQRKSKAKALPEARSVPFIAQSPPAPGFGGVRPPVMKGNRPVVMGSR
jgi:hypothetical protein